MNNIKEIMARGIAGQQGQPNIRPVHEKAAQAAITALTEAGYAIVPVEPSKAMVNAGLDSIYDQSRDTNPQSLYKAMISASGQGE